VRFGVIGAGMMGRLHAANLVSRVPGAKLIAVSDVDPAACAAVVAQLPVEAVYEDYRRMLALAEIDAVVISTPPELHAEIIEAAAIAGKHVFCEKPLACELDGAGLAIAAVNRAGIKLQIGFNRRFDRRFRDTREAIRAGNIGDVYTVHVVSRDPARRPDEVPKFEPEMYLDTTIHDLDMVRFVSGREAQSVYAVGQPLPRKSASPQTAVTLLSLDGGAIATIDNSWLSPVGYDQRLEVFGSQGVITVANETKAGDAGEDASRPFFVRRYFDSYVAEMVAFVEAIVKDEGPLVTGEDGREALRLALACRRSWREGRPVAVSEIG